jgi:hypothetical protein
MKTRKTQKIFLNNRLVIFILFFSDFCVFSRTDPFEGGKFSLFMLLRVISTLNKKRKSVFLMHISLTHDIEQNRPT